MSDAAIGPYQHCRPLTDEEYAALKADIEAHGVMEYVHVDENGAILVGHHRARAAAELGIEYPRHVVTGLSEQQKHEYAVRLESLGRSRDMETKRWTALHLWRDPAVKVSKTKLGELVGVDEKAIRNWITEDDKRLAREAEINGQVRLPPSEPDRVTDVLGRERPTTYAPRQPVAAVAEPDAEPGANDDEEDALSIAGLLPPDDRPTVGDVLQEIAEHLDESGAFEAVDQEARERSMRATRLGWLRLVSEHPPGVLLDGVKAGEIPELMEDLDRFINWLQTARGIAAGMRRPRRVEA